MLDVLHLEEVQKPTPGDGEVLVKVQAASVNPLDWHFLRGTPFPIRFVGGLINPKHKILGADVAGGLGYMNELLEAGKVVSVIDRSFPLSAVPEAIRYLEKGHARGKVVISM